MTCTYSVLTDESLFLRIKIAHNNVYRYCIVHLTFRANATSFIIRER